jgi:hypothetical protein
VHNLPNMKTRLVIRFLAILSLLVVAASNIVSSTRQVPGAPVEMRLAPVFGIAVWSLLLWKVWKRPRKWGLGVGIFLFLMIVFQSYLFWLSVHSPKLEAPDVDQSVTRFILLYELPIFIAGVSCTLLRFYYPDESSEGLAENTKP